MYARFFRWASDRVDENGVVAFVSNSSFIDSRTFDGFRKVVAKEFNEIWIVDLKGNARTSGERRRQEGGNIFDDQIRVGVAVYFCIKKKGTHGCRIFYEAVRDYAKSDEKRDFLTTTRLIDRPFVEIQPDAKQNWINLTQNDFESLMPVATKETKAAKKPSQERTIFKLFSLGISTNRDEWVYSDDPSTLAEKAKLLTQGYESQAKGNEFHDSIKWSRNLKRRFEQGRRESFDKKRIVRAQYRPFSLRWLYDSDLFIDEGGSKDEIFPLGCTNRAICFSDIGSRTAYVVLAIEGLADLHFGSSIDAYQQTALWRYENGERIDNITDWALDQFRKHYSPVTLAKAGVQKARGKAVSQPCSVAEGVARRGGLRRRTAGSTAEVRSDRTPEAISPMERLSITKEDIFHYVYGVLHDPIYREKYALNLKREFPRIPFYADFRQWADWGKELMELHIGYETVEPWNLVRTDTADDGHTPKAMLKADKENGRIVLDSRTTLAGIPPEAWTYKLGNRSALEWILDQYKEKKSKDPTIREKFNTYRFADYKEKVIDLLARVTTVSVRTQQIVDAQKAATR